MIVWARVRPSVTSSGRETAKTCESGPPRAGPRPKRLLFTFDKKRRFLSKHLWLALADVCACDPAASRQANVIEG